jgi:hypothetical protein
VAARQNHRNRIKKNTWQIRLVVIILTFAYKCLKSYQVIYSSIAGVKLQAHGTGRKAGG